MPVYLFNYIYIYIWINNTFYINKEIAKLFVYKFIYKILNIHYVIFL